MHLAGRHHHSSATEELQLVTPSKLAIENVSKSFKGASGSVPMAERVWERSIWTQAQAESDKQRSARRRQVLPRAGRSQSVRARQRSRAFWWNEAACIACSCAGA